MLHEPAIAAGPPPRGAAPDPRLPLPAVLVLIIGAHWTIDAYSAFLHPLLPRLMANLNISIALAATAATVLSLAASLPQPAFGYLADRYGRRAFLALGPIVAGVLISSMGLAPGYVTLLLLLSVGGLGSAAFHPPGASLVARASEGRGSGVRMSLFSFGGALGFATGPIASVFLVQRVGLAGLWVAMIPGCIFGLALWFGVRGRTTVPNQQPPPPPLKVLALLKGPLGLLFTISALGAFVQRTIMTFLPIIASDAGVGESVGAIILAIYLGAQALGTLAAGVLTDRLNRQHLLAAIVTISVPAHLLAVILPPASTGAIAMAALAGFLNMALVPPIVVMAQEIVPSGTAASSGIVMGLAWAIGTLGIPIAGVFADAFGPVSAAGWSIPVLLVGTFCALHPSLRPFSRAR